MYFLLVFLQKQIINQKLIYLLDCYYNIVIYIIQEISVTLNIM